MENYPVPVAHPLDPQQLDDAGIRAVTALLAEGQSENTRRSYTTALRYWAAWFALRYGRKVELPLSPVVLIQFIVDHAERMMEDGSLAHELPASINEQLVQQGFKARPGALSLSTLNHRIAVLSQLHRVRSLQNPCEDPSVRQLLARTRRAYATRGVRVTKKPALTQDLLQKLLATCNDSLAGKRDRALLLFAVASGGRRRSEIVTASFERLQRISPGQFVYTMGQTKTNQSAQEDPSACKPVTGDAGVALEEWLSASGITSGAIFRRILKGNHVAGPLNPAAVRTIVRARAQQAGIGDGFSAHSLRSGFLTEAGLRNIPLAEAMALSGHASVKVAMGYFRAGNVLTSTAGKLFDYHEQNADE
jgi:integrase